jgi:hypothetical protein
VARWAGWFAGPAGAGSAGGPSRPFLGAMFAGSGVVTAVLLFEGRLGPAAVAAGAMVYFGLRLFAGLGRKR